MLSGRSSATTGCNKAAGDSESGSSHPHYNSAVRYTNQAGNHHYNSAIYHASLVGHSEGGNKTDAPSSGDDDHGQKPLAQLTATQPMAEQQKEFSSTWFSWQFPFIS